MKNSEVKRRMRDIYSHQLYFRSGKTKFRELFVHTPLIVVAAAEFEALPSLQALNHLKIPFRFHEIGIGSIESAKAARGLSEIVRSKPVLYLGSCGIFGKFERPFLLSTQKVIWAPACERLGLSYRPKGTDMPICIPPSTLPLPLHDVVCAPCITLSDSFNSFLLENNFESPPVENLELYSVAKELSLSSTSFDVILGVTNKVAESAHEQWKSHYAQVANMAGEFVLRHHKLFFGRQNHGV